MASTPTKAKILKRLETERRRLEHTVAGLGPADMLCPGVVGEWSAKDVLAHLADWEAHMIVWVEAGRHGDPVKSPDPGLTWRQFDVFNQRVYVRHCDHPIDEVFDYFYSTHTEFMAMVEAMPEDEMLTPGRYRFLGRGTIYGWLGQYADHDRWGDTEIRRWIDSREQTEAV